jgi:hypothetical protein
MANDTERLVIELEARIRDFERNMEKASRTASKEFGAIEGRGKQAAQRVEGLFSQIGKNINSSVGGSFLAGGLAGLISEQSVRALGQMVKSVADMADEAARVNLPVEDFQALVYTARQAGIEQENVTTLFQKFQLSIGDAVAKGNDLQKILEANGVKLTDSNGKIRTQKELFYDVVNLIKNARTQQEAALIANEAFGKSAKDALPFLQQGADAIREGEQAAHDVGAVISEELVKKAAAFDDAFTSAWDSFKAHGKTAVLEVMGEVQDLGSTLDNLIKKSGIRSSDLRTTGIIPKLNDNQVLELEKMFPSLKDRTSEQTQLQEKLVRLEKESAKLGDEIQQQFNAGLNNDFVQFQVREWDELNKKVQETKASIAEIQKLNVNVGPGPSFEKYGRSGQGSTSTPTRVTIIPPLGKPSKRSDNDKKELERATNGGILDLVGHAEGTDKGRGYNEVLGYGAYGGKDANLTLMSLKQIQVLQEQIRKNPKNPYNSGAVGRYEIVGSTLKGLMKDLNLSGDEKYDEKMQDKLASVLAARRGNNLKGLRSEWQGLNKIPDKNINDAMGNSSHVIESGTAALNQRENAVKKLTASQRSETQSLEVERRSMEMSYFSAEKYKKSQELLSQAKAAGIPITRNLKTQVEILATQHAVAATKIENYRQAQVRAAQSAREAQKANQDAAASYAKMGDTFASATKGFLQDLMDGKTGAEALQNALGNLASQAMNMAVDSIFKGLFSGGMGGAGKGGSAGKGGGIAMALGFADGGYVRGAGTGKSDSIPAMLSNGEFVINAESTSKHAALLEAINSGKTLRFADGGLVGAKAVPMMAPVAANSNSNQAITVTNNVSVNATGGSPAQNEDLAKQIGKQIEASIKQGVVRELMQQRRPGNMLAR